MIGRTTGIESDFILMADGEGTGRILWSMNAQAFTYLPASFAGIGRVSGHITETKGKIFGLGRSRYRAVALRQPKSRD